MKTRVVQIAAGATPGDAITNEIILLHRHFEKVFSDSLVFAEHIAPGLSIRVRKPDAYRPSVHDVILFHHSISMQSTDAVCRLDLPRIMIYHNITPAHFFLPYNAVIAEHLTKARRELGRLSHHFDFCYGDSEFNRREISAAGHKATGVLPVVFPRLFQKQSKPALNVSVQDPERPVILFVGRIVPNKGHADLIKIFVFIRKILPGAHLILAGSEHAGIPSYREELNRLTQYLGVSDAVTITGYLSEEQLDDLYRSADLLLCASHHEGYCVPVLEAMACGIPVMAFAGGESAVEETLDGAGVQFTKMEHAAVAGMAARLILDKDLRRAVISAQEERIARIQPDQVFDEITSRLKASASEQ